MSNLRRVVCVISSLGNGGAERVMLELCAAFREAGVAVTLLTLSAADSDFYAVPEGVERVALDVLGVSMSAFSALQSTWTRIVALRKAIRRARPDVVLSFMDRTNVLVLLATRAMRVPVVVAERNNPWMLPIGRSWDVLRRITYRWASAITIQTTEVGAFFPVAMQKLLVVIPNAVTPASGPTAQRTTTVLAAGRLEPQKGFDLLIRAFAATRAIAPEWRLRIVGEGSQRAALKSLSAGLGLTASAIELPGRSTAMPEEYARAGVFVLSSRFEGFPNVLCEAMSHGCAVVATRCSSGPGDIVRDRVDGVLVPVNDVEALTAALAELMRDADLRHRLGQQATMLPQRFPASSINAHWLRVLENALCRA